MARLGNRVLVNHTLLLRHTSPVVPTLHVPPQGLSEEQGNCSDYIYSFKSRNSDSGKSNRNVEMPWDTYLAQDVINSKCCLDLGGWFQIGRKAL